MRFKKINIENRSNKYSEQQRDSLMSISANLNKIGEFFDILIEFEQSVIKDIKKELTDFLKIRENREEIIKENGKKYYIDNFFIPIANELESALTIAIENWNTNKNDFNIEILNGFINNLKILNNSLRELKKVTGSTIETFDAIQNLINTFGNFTVYKAVISDNRAERFEALLMLQDNIDNINESSDDNTVNKKLTIDDL